MLVGTGRKGNPDIVCWRSYRVRVDLPLSEQLLKKILGSIAPSVMIPKHRLAVLLDQVKQNQISRCLYHNPSSSPSLFSDHMCDRSQFPLRTILELGQNAGEVWAMEFSHDGRRLATSGQATDVLIYETSTFQLLYRLTEHTDHVAALAWSPDDSRLITCSHDKTARVWDMLVCLEALMLPALLLTNIAVRPEPSQDRLSRTPCHSGFVVARWPDFRHWESTW